MVGDDYVGSMTDTRGIVHPRVGLEHFRLNRYSPSDALAPYVDRLWCVSWDLEDGEVFDQPILAHPTVNVVIEPERAAVYGVPTRLGRQRLTGHGWAVAAMFKPGGARPFMPGPLRESVDRAVPISDRWPEQGSELVGSIRTMSGDPAAVEIARAGALESFLIRLAPAEVPAETADAVGCVALVAAHRELCRVEHLAERSGIKMRSLQRLFAQNVGISPKKVIRRYRLLEAAEAASHGGHVSWADVATDLGFSDQAHLTRDFTAAFGVSPARYATG